MPESRQISVELRCTVSPALRRFMDAAREAGQTMAERFTQMTRAMARIRQHLESFAPDFDDRWYIRSLRRAEARSVRNQPPVPRHDCPRCHGYGHAGVWDGELVGDCPRCGGSGDRRTRHTGGRASRKRNKHGRKGVARCRAIR